MKDIIPSRINHEMTRFRLKINVETWITSRVHFGLLVTLRKNLEKSSFLCANI